MSINFGALLHQEPQETAGHAKVIDVPSSVHQKVNNYDLTPIRTALAPYEAQINNMADTAAVVQVMDDKTNILAVEMASQAKRLNNAIEKSRKEFVDPANQFVKAVNNLAKNYQGKLQAIEGGLKSKISGYQTKLEMERRKREEAERKARLELQKKIEAEAALLNIEAPVMAPAVVPEVVKVIRTEAGTASQRKEWRFEVTDESQVPREYMAVDLGKIRQAVKAGIREIRGIRIFEESVTTLRI
jgi:hypothetical protein